MIEIIPAIDVMNGYCVRLERGDFRKMVIYDKEPLNVAKRYEDHGLRRLHLIDLDGAKEGKIIQHKVLEKIATHTNLLIDYGGGIKTDDDLRIVFNSGAGMVTAGSVAVSSGDTVIRWLEQYGAEKIILGADTSDMKVAVQAWQNVTEVNVLEFIQDYYGKGFTKVICTAIDKDGMLGGPAFNLYKEILKHFEDLELIASGGIAAVEDIEQLQDDGLKGVIIGKALYEKTILLKDLYKFL